MPLIKSRKAVYTPHATNTIPPNVGFIANISGVLHCELRDDDAASVTGFPVTAGVFYEHDIRLFHTASTGVTELTVFQARRS